MDKNYGVYLVRKKRCVLPTFQNLPAGNICSEHGIACVTGTKLQTIFSSMCGMR